MAHIYIIRHFFRLRHNISISPSFTTPPNAVTQNVQLIHGAPERNRNRPNPGEAPNNLVVTFIQNFYCRRSQRFIIDSLNYRNLFLMYDKKVLYMNY